MKAIKAMKKILYSLCKGFFLLILSSALISCPGITGSSGETSQISQPASATKGSGIKPAVRLANPVNLSGRLSTQDQSSSRSAFPSSPDLADLYYDVSAVHAANSSYTSTGHVTKGTGASYSIVLLYSGTWNITITAYSDSGKTKKVLTASSEIEMTTEDKEADIDLSYFSSSSESGTVSLPISFPSDANIVLVNFSGTLVTSGGGSSVLIPSSSSCTLSGTTYSYNYSATVAPGSYTLTATFTDNSGFPIFRFSESVNVYSNLTTDTFSGSSSYISSGKIAITPALIEKYRQTTIYVNSSGLDTNSGSYFKPKKTLAGAASLLDKIYDGSSEYTIIVQSDITETTTNTEILLSSMSGLKIQGDDADSFHKITGNGKQLVIDSVSIESLHFDSFAGIFISGGEVTMENCKITGGTSATNGGGISIGSQGSLTAENLEISSCSAENGGGISVEGTGTDANGVSNTATANLTNCTISGCTATTSGGGIYASGEHATVTLTGCTLESNTAGKGGGIYTLTSLAISDGTIKENEAMVGGGVYLDSSEAGTAISSTMTDGLISENTATVAGGGIYISGDSEFTMSGGAVVKNTAGSSSGTECYGGGIFSAGLLKISGGLIAENTVLGPSSMTGGGGGVCLNKNSSASTSEAEISGGTIGGGSYGGLAYSGNSVGYGYGGGIATFGANISMTGGTVGGNSSTNGNSAKVGAGIYLNYRSADDGLINPALTISSDAVSIKYNSSSQWGGGIAADAGAVYMQAGSISYNSAASTSASIPVCGGGIYNYGAEVNVSGTAKISGNTINSSGIALGGGIYVYNSGTINFTGGSILSNEINGLSSQGGGIYSTGTTNLASGKINNNKVTGSGIAHGGGFSVRNGNCQFIDYNVETTGNTAETGAQYYIADDSSLGYSVSLTGTINGTVYNYEILSTTLIKD